MPSPYNPYYYQQQFTPQPQQIMNQNPMSQMPQMQMQQPQIQNGGFVSVRNEAEARNYPIAIGNSITFKDETAPYVYTKTMGFSQLDRPIFEKYRLVKEDVSEPQNLPQEGTGSMELISNSIKHLEGENEAIWKEIESIKSILKEIESVKNKFASKPKKKEEEKETISDE